MHATATDLPMPDALPDVRVPPPGPLSRAALVRLQAHESPNVTAVATDCPIVWQAARGSAVRDLDGNTYVDATSAFGVALIGHGHPEVVAAIREAAGDDTLVMGWHGGQDEDGRPKPGGPCDENGDPVPFGRDACVDFLLFADDAVRKLEEYCYETQNFRAARAEGIVDTLGK